MKDKEVNGHDKRIDLEITQVSPTSSFGITGVLTVGHPYYSPNRTYSLVCQGDGNLIIYGPSGAEWSTGTHGNGNICVMQTDGSLVIYTNDGSPTWHSYTFA